METINNQNIHSKLRCKSSFDVLQKWKPRAKNGCGSGRVDGVAGTGAAGAPSDDSVVDDSTEGGVVAGEADAGGRGAT